MNHSEIFEEANGVHADGQEPLHTAEEYESALLSVARLAQKPTETIADAMARVTRNGNPDATALIFAATRVRDREAATLGKAVATRAAAERAMLDLARAEAQPGEGTAAAFARLCESDARMQKLYDAGEAAERAEVEQALSKRDPDDRFTPMLMDLAKSKRRSGETIEAAASRLLSTDPVVMDAYAWSQGL